MWMGPDRAEVILFKGWTTFQRDVADRSLILLLFLLFFMMSENGEQ